jgi:hypothetical protein
LIGEAIECRDVLAVGGNKQSILITISDFHLRSLMIEAMAVNIGGT